MLKIHQICGYTRIIDVAENVYVSINNYLLLSDVLIVCKKFERFNLRTKEAIEIHVMKK
jgi:hypothetical protein